MLYTAKFFGTKQRIFVLNGCTLIKVRAIDQDREEMKRMVDIFRGRIIDVTDKSYTIELTGTGSKLDAFLNTIERSTILETVRTGASGIGRGERILKA